VNCLLCGSDYLHIVTDQLRNGPGEVLRCADCDLEMLNAPVVDYEAEYRDTHGPVLGERPDAADIFNAYRPYQDQRVALLEAELGPDATLLEVGCSAGQFLDAVKDRVGKATGVEPDPLAAKHAATTTGCSVYPNLQALPKGRYDIICLFQVVEHMGNPLEELAAVTRYLADGGTLCVEVPSLTDPLLTLYDNAAYRRFFYHEAHGFYFSPKSLRALMKQLGFTGLVYGVQDYTFLNHLHWQYANKPQPDCHAGLKAEWPAGPLPEYGNLLDRFAFEVDRRYKMALIQAGCTENIAFLGTRI
jgi:SAM-dependent methyltransferase